MWNKLTTSRLKDSSHIGIEFEAGEDLVAPRRESLSSERRVHVREIRYQFDGGCRRIRLELFNETERVDKVVLKID